MAVASAINGQILPGKPATALPLLAPAVARYPNPLLPVLGTGLLKSTITNAPALHAAGTIAYGSTSVAAPYPVLTSGDKLLLTVGTKPNTATISTPSGWTLVGTYSGGAGTTGANTGPTTIAVFEKLATGSESGTVTVSITSGNSSWAQITSWMLPPGCDSWYSATAAGNADTTTGAAWSVTCDGNPGLQPNDTVYVASCTPTNVAAGSQFSAESVSVTGVTGWGSFTEISEPNSATGNRVAGFTFYGSVTAGTGAGLPVVAATASGTTTNVSGPSIMVRLRAYSSADSFQIAPWVHTTTNYGRSSSYMTSEVGVFKDVTTGQLVFGAIDASVTNGLRLWTSADNGKTWSGPIGTDTSLSTYSFRSLTQSSDGYIHCLLLGAGGAPYTYARLSPSYTSGALTGYSVSATYTIGTGSETGELKGAIQVIKDQSGTECLFFCGNTPNAGGTGIFTFCQKTLTTTPAAGTDWTKLDGTSGITSIEDRATAGLNNHEQDCVFGQIPSTQVIWVATSRVPMEHVIDSFTLNRFKLTPTGAHTWSVGSAVVGVASAHAMCMAQANDKLFLLANYVNTDTVADPLGATGLSVDLIDSSDTYTRAYLTNSAAWIDHPHTQAAISCSGDGSKVYVVTETWEDPYSYCVFSAWNGSTWVNHQAEPQVFSFNGPFGFKRSVGWDNGLCLLRPDLVDISPWTATFYLVPSAAASSAVAGTASGVGTASATVAATGVIAGSSAGVGTPSATVLGAVDVAGSSAGVGSASANAVGTSAIAGTSAGVGAASATLAGTGAIAGTSAGVGTGTDTLAGTGALAGSCAGVGSATCTAGVLAQFAGTSAGTGSATGTGVATFPASGTSAGVGTAAATAAGTGTIAGTIAGTGTASTTLAGNVPVAGTSAGVGTPTGTLAGSGALAGSSPGVGTATGTAAGRGAVAGTSAGVATAQAGIFDHSSSSGTAAGVGTASATLTAQGALAGSSGGTGTPTAAMTGLAPLAGACTGTGTATTTAQLRVAVSGAAAGIGAASASPTASVGVSGAAAGSSSAGITVGSGLLPADWASYPITWVGSEVQGTAYVGGSDTEQGPAYVGASEAEQATAYVGG